MISTNNNLINKPILNVTPHTISMKDSSSSSSSASSTSYRSFILFCIVSVTSMVLGIMIGIVITPTLLNSSSSSSSTPKSQKDKPSNAVAEGLNASPLAPSPPLSQNSIFNSNKDKKSTTPPKDPRIAFVGYMDRVPNAGMEVKWMYFSAYGSNVKGDILLMGHPLVGAFVPHFCTVLRGANATVEKARQALKAQVCMDNGWPRSRKDKTNAAMMNNASTSLSPEATTPCNVRCLIIANAQDDQMAVKLNYPFLRSMYFPNDPVLPTLLREDYDYVLKTDLDVFFTPRFNALRPPPGRIYGGKGAYVFYDEVSQRLKRIAKDLKLKHRLLHNVGATWYGDPETILMLTSLARNVTIYILQNEYRDGPGKWAGWYRGVSSMYGGEIAVNHVASNYMKGQLDMPCNNGASTCQGSLIHAWHQVEVFSKFDVNKYNAAKTFEDAGSDEKFKKYMSKAGNYALYTAMNVKSGIDVPPMGPWGISICK